jgi:hypothetical protein
MEKRKNSCAASAAARKAAERVAAAMGRGWRASDGPAPSKYRFLNGGEDGMMRCRFEYVADGFAYVAFQGRSWLEALDGFFGEKRIAATAWWRDVMEKLGASSAEELVLKTAVSGENWKIRKA